MTASLEQSIFDDLCDYTKRDRDLVKARCKSAATELAWQWENKKDVLSYYRDTDLYIFDLTLYQIMLAQNLTQMLQEIKVKKVKKILDFGGGIGEYTIRAIKELGADVTYLELKDSKTLEYAKWRFAKHGVKPRIVDENFAWQNEKWDVVFVMDVLEHLEKPAPVIKTLEKIAKYIFCNPEAIQFNWLFPQHISHFVLANFSKIGLNLYQSKKNV